MRALVFTAIETLRFQDAPDPVLAEGQALVRIAASGICGSDMHAYIGHDPRRQPPSLIMGHEAAGVVQTGARAGQRVTINPLVACGTCRACVAGEDNLCPERSLLSLPPAQGCFADMVAIREENLISIPDGVSYDQAALAEPLACGWHAVRLGLRSLSIAASNTNALVIGGGAIGVGVALSLRAQGVEQVTVIEPNDLRRDRLQGVEGFAALAPGDARLPGKNSVDLVIDAVGYAATRAVACDYVRPGGTIVHIGLGDGEGGLDIRRMTLQEITFIGTYTYTPQDFRDTAAAIFDGRLGSLDWTELRPMADGDQAFQDIRAGRVASPKIILTP